MDLLRGAISALLYRFPIESLGNTIINASSSPNDETLDTLTEILKWEHKTFTKSDITLLRKIVEQDWSVSNEYGIDLDSYPKLTYRYPLLLNEFSSKVLILHGQKDPIVVFNELLRWRAISLYIGEDVLVLPFVAEHDVKRMIKRKSFLWPQVLQHDNMRINAILDKELSDTHAHINASTDIFIFNWLRMMNYPNHCSTPLKDKCWYEGEHKEYDSVKRFNMLNYSLMEWAFIASAIRVFLYEITSTNRQPNLLNRENILKLFYHEKFNYAGFVDVNNTIGIQMHDALPTKNHIILDYAISQYDFPGAEIPTSPMMVYHGKRQLMYRWFYGYYSGDEECRKNADLMLLYLIIKCKIRREFIQTNPLVGFVNFQNYDHDKATFLPQNKAYWEIVYRYAVQTSVGDNCQYNLEARMTPMGIKDFMRTSFRDAIFGDDLYIKNEIVPVSIIAHFIKQPDKSSLKEESSLRHISLRKQLATDVHKLLNYTNKVKNDSDTLLSTNLPNLVGIDAAGSEFNCRPEVFAPYFRYARTQGIENFTFHAGEDFYDILDGLRAVDEVVKFMGYRFGDRIGHGLALGVNVSKFYAERLNTLLIPNQILLDNLVWLKYTAAHHNIQLSPSTFILIEEQFSELSDKLGYASLGANSHNYFLSMNMRGDYVMTFVPNDELILGVDVLYSPASPGKNCSPTVSALWRHYERDRNCRIEGEKVIMLRLNPEYAEDVAKVQHAILLDLEARGIVIETNPSSNIRIGRFTRYDEHPITNFHSISETDNSQSLMVSINTDDKGIFFTSLTNEYSLIAAALRKKKDLNGQRKWTDAQIETYLRKIAHYGNISRFQDTNVFKRAH